MPAPSYTVIGEEPHFAESKPLENPRDLVYFAAWHAKGCVVLPHGLGVWCLK
jgi:hypothetical protein